MKKILALLTTLALCGCVTGPYQVQLMGRNGGQIHPGTITTDSNGRMTLSVTLDQTQYSGPLVRTSSSDSYGYIESLGIGGGPSSPRSAYFSSYGDSVQFKALLNNADGQGMRCDLLGTGRGQGGGVCLDDGGHTYDLIFTPPGQ
ncbi:MAG: hypothetical protein JSR19_02925 [Proteobacteria bacterium]|nr:hypothetical protein [Pseudomonadota bacterium]HQR03846.1 hypothetical protein [Rhodocyclaceae bacterium]